MWLLLKKKWFLVKWSIKSPVSLKHAANLRSNHPEVLCKKGVLRNFAKLTGKHLHQSFFNKIY